MSTQRTLLVLRHAKAAGEPGVNDAARPLTRRGQRDATSAGRWLAVEGLEPERVLCSSAQRTRETWEQVSAELGAAASAEVDFERRVYDAGADDMLDLIREQSDQVASIMTVGHNPASHRLVLTLTARDDLAFPTCALAVIHVHTRWADLSPGEGELAHLWTPHTHSLPSGTIPRLPPWSHALGLEHTRIR
jgi:phosphohistidine phosphatase